MSVEGHGRKILMEKRQKLGGKPVPVPLSPPQISHGHEPGPPLCEAGD
jgi:hypothetical protein